MSAKSTLCILFRDEEVQVVFIDRTFLGAQIKFMERLPCNELVFEEIARLTKSVEKTPARVLLCVPRDLVIQRTLHYPAMSPADIAGMIQFEASRHVPLPENERALAWSSTHSADQKQVIINLLAGRESELRSLVSSLQDVGVPVDEAVPFSSAVLPILATRSTLLVVSDVRKVELCLYGEGQLQDSQLLTKDAPGFSPERVITAARQMAVKNRDWLGMEGIAQILHTGEAPLSDTFTLDLGAAFGLEVRPLEVPESLGEVKNPLKDVLLAASSDLPEELNLIEHSDRKVPISKRTLLVAALCAVLVVELVAWQAFRTASPALQRRQVAEEIAQVKRRAAPIQRMKEKNRAMRKQLYRLDEICNRHVSSMQVLHEVSELLPEDTYLQTIYFNDNALNIRGLSKEPDRLPELLLAAPRIGAISKSDIGKKEGDYHAINIVVTMGASDERNRLLKYRAAKKCIYTSEGLRC